ncbi:MAG: protein kinase [Okeania sp. SIO3I5]|uniref:serine/threonine-protein kinase n=1 Tax=Okeania sp. SIO3I5 TaxID=2607805 RepID=UPI0013BD0A34|nr:serine/threonine-protein kinase [Okeania sp. SIO3I5]NEQ39263.1 protein kinase [Okeania sp. SIO3I5]
MTNRILRHRYQIISELGKGGFGTTYLAADQDLPNHPQCVVKQLTPSDPRPEVFQVAKTLFDKEAKTLQRLGKHEQLPQLFAYFEEGGQFYLVQEFIEGNDLTKEIYPGKKFSEKQAIQLLTEILEVLKYVHEENVIHRDLKPQNIMRRKSDGKIVLIDFGAVKEIKVLSLTGEGIITTTIAVGTPGYMPTEQAAGQPRFCSDIYAVGITIIAALTGMSANQLPKDDSTGEIIWKNQVNVSEKFARVLDKMVLYDWRNRYQTVDEIIPLPPPPPPNSWVKKVLGGNGVKVLGVGIGSAVLALIIASIKGKALIGDYSQLEVLLAEEKWKEADIETEKIMLQVADREKEAWLDHDSIDKFPCQDLKKIDQLWVKSSDGHFGFSIRKPIYLKTGNQLRIFRQESYERFGEEVGWRKNGEWLTYPELGFSLNSPEGHLPAPHRKRTTAQFAPHAFLLDRLTKCEADYSQLEVLLAEGKWEEADRKTEKIMLQVANRESEGWLEKAAIYNFSCSDLKRIDQLWVENSNEHFGFSVQKSIYLDTGNKLGSYKKEFYERFGEEVGWRKNGEWLTYPELVFSLNSPKGHLPATHRKRTSSAIAQYAFLLDRLAQCNNQ